MAVEHRLIEWSNTPSTHMKTVLSLLAAVSVYSIAIPVSAAPPYIPNAALQPFAVGAASPYMSNAGVQPYPGERRIVSYLTNGTPVYAVYQAMGFDAMGYPIYQWVTLPVSSGYVRPYYGYNHGYRNYGYRSYNYRPSYVRPTFVNPPHVSPHFNFGSHGGSLGHFGGAVNHGGGHMSHGGGGHVSHGGGGHVSHGGGGHHR